VTNNKTGTECDFDYNTVLSKKLRPFDITKMYIDLASYLRKIHPEISIPEDVRELTGYNPIYGSILDDYKSVLHLKMLRRIKDLGVLGNGSDIIADILEKHGLPKDMTLASHINLGINDIMKKWLGPENNISI